MSCCEWLSNMNKNRIFVVLMSALSVVSLGITLISSSHAHWFPPGGGSP
ncbi:MAG: hypothetical protein ACTSP9_06200 [Promethearchaeota archaeon]